MDSMRTVVITGASTGIGRATALRLAVEGWLVFVGVRTPTDAPVAPPGAAGSIEALLLDVTTDVDDAARIVAGRLAERPLTAVVNNAGVGVLAPMQTVGLDELRAVHEVNVLGVVRVTQAFLPLLGPGGRIVVVGSVGDRLTMPFGGPLTSSKWAAASITEAFRLELAGSGVSVVLVEPGSIHSNAVDKVEAQARATTARLERHDPQLARRFARSAAVAIGHERGGSAPEVVARAISRSLDRPRRRVLVGRHARLLATASAVLPDAILDRVRLRVFLGPERLRSGRGAGS